MRRCTNCRQSLPFDSFFRPVGGHSWCIPCIRQQGRDRSHQAQESRGAMEGPLKRCPGCELELPPQSFYASGHHSRCIPCCRTRERERHQVRRSLERDSSESSCKRRRTEETLADSDQTLGERTPEGDADAPDSLYLAHNPRIPGEVKVGRAKNPEARMKDLSVSQNFSMALLQTWPGLGHLEREVHEQLATHRLRGYPGRKWFGIHSEAAGLVDELILALQMLQNTRNRLVDQEPALS